MKIAIMGAGGLGGFFGGKLAQVGHDVWFNARRQQLAALKTTGCGCTAQTLRLLFQIPKLRTDQPRSGQWMWRCFASSSTMWNPPPP